MRGECQPAHDSSGCTVRPRARDMHRQGAMTLEIVIIWLIVGLIAGWLASQLVRGGGSGVATDIVVGIVGAFIGGLIFRAEHWRVPFGGYAGPRAGGGVPPPAG